MHYFKRNIGDYHKKAGRLTMLQHGAYTLLIDACYDREAFPTKEDAIDWCWASSDEEIRAVEFVLKKFFIENDGVYEQLRIKYEIEKYHSNAATNKRIAREREAKRKEKSTKRVRIVNEASTTGDEAPPNHKPRTINQEPRTKEPIKIPDWINQESWKEFLSIRKKNKAVNSELAIKKIINKLEKFKALGYDPNELVDNSIVGGWKDIYQPRDPPKQQSTIINQPLVKEFV